MASIVLVLRKDMFPCASFGRKYQLMLLLNISRIGAVLSVPWKTICFVPWMNYVQVPKTSI